MSRVASLTPTVRNEALSLVGVRVDGLVIAVRVALADEFVARLGTRAAVAGEHGRAGFEYTNERGSICGELRWSRAKKVWNLTREPVEPDLYGYQLRVDAMAPGGGTLSDCRRCKGRGFFPRLVDCDGCGTRGCGLCRGVGQQEIHVSCARCEGGVVEEPGFTIEIVWRAQALAQWGAARLLDDAIKLASVCGDVYESRVRRIDLCADVAGWEIRSEDVSRLAKRPRAKWAVDDDGIEREDERESRGCHGTGALRRRHITGISVGRGGALMARLYDKRCELERDDTRRALEEARWKDNGWDGEAPVARVEFQIRGVVLNEFGLRNPDCAIDPTTRAPLVACAACGICRPAVTDETDRKPKRLVPCECGEREAREATLIDRLPDVWTTCLQWVRLIVPGTTRRGRAVPAVRCALDPRWALLHEVKWSERAPRPIRRHRVRGVASAAQALGVTLSAAAKDGRLRPLEEDRYAYADDERTREALRRRLLALKRSEAMRVLKWLEERYEGPAGAAVHFAVRANAARLRFKRGVVDADLSTGPPDGDGPRSEVRPRASGLYQGSLFETRGAVA